LLTESGINRQILQLEAGHIHFRLEQVKRGWLRTGWRWAVPFAGFLFARKFKKAGGLFAKGSFALLLLRKGWEAWQNRKS
jgi:hypothetical protein